MKIFLLLLISTSALAGSLKSIHSTSKGNLVVSTREGNQTRLVETTSGSYIPIATEVTNNQSGGLGFPTLHYFRVGNMVTVFGGGSFNQSVAGVITFTLSLPIPSDLISNTDLAGSGAPFRTTGTGYSVVNIRGDSTNDVAHFETDTPNSLSRSINFSFSYIVR